MTTKKARAPARGPREYQCDWCFQIYPSDMMFAHDRWYGGKACQPCDMPVQIAQCENSDYFEERYHHYDTMRGWVKP